MMRRWPVVMVGVWVMVGSITIAQERVPVPIPALPEGGDVCPLALVDGDSRIVPPRDLELVRAGHAGSLLEPRALSLSRGVTGWEIQRWDWLRVIDRELVVAFLQPYQPWISLEQDSFAVVTGEQRLSLWYGDLHWIDWSFLHPDARVVVGPYVVGGRGEARITRLGGALRIAVTSGTFEVSRSGERIASLGAGQSYEGELPPVHGEVASARYTDLQTGLDGALEELIAGGEPSTASLRRLSETIEFFGPLFCSAEVRREAWFAHPDIVLREVAEGLRFLSAYRFRE